MLAVMLRGSATYREKKTNFNNMPKKDKLTFLSLLWVSIFFTSGYGQEKTNTLKDPNTSKPSPTVVKGFKAAALAPDFDTTLFTTKDGLGGTEFWGIYIEQSGIIWVTARGCTTRFDPSIPLPNPKAFAVFTVEDGINCCVQSMYQDKSGNMWWGTGQGLYRFDGKRFYQVKQDGWRRDSRGK